MADYEWVYAYLDVYIVEIPLFKVCCSIFQYSQSVGMSLVWAGCEVWKISEMTSAKCKLKFGVNGQAVTRHQSTVKVGEFSTNPCTYSSATWDHRATHPWLLCVRVSTSLIFQICASRCRHACALLISGPWIHDNRCHLINRHGKPGM